MDSAAGSCNACGATGTALMKLSLGKDFFGRIYDRLSPSTDQSPKWYCEACSMQKNLQRDFRDISAEIDKLVAGQTSELSKPDEFQRATLRVREIVALLDTVQNRSSLLTSAEVTRLLERLNTVTVPA
ncbi:MAG: hypothetical protein EHM80_07075 [Nitrospiraceae bacterium]|nr:MAG: hypothetical protein EHM80_07075 [Nitrospiraceae bacterium]